MPMKSHFQIALFLALLAVKQAARVAINKIEAMLDDKITANDSTSSPGVFQTVMKKVRRLDDFTSQDLAITDWAFSPAFYIVQLADIQLGMLNFKKETPEEAKDFSAEADNLKHAVKSILQLRPPPAAVVMSGDMQNFWSKDLTSNLALSDEGIGDYGDVQANKVMELMTPLEDEGIPVRYTPGNHDLDDVVDMNVLLRYKELWGDDYYSFQIDNVFFMSINSQMYYRRNHEQDVIDHEKAQTEWILTTFLKLQDMEPPPAAIVILTHIPPFIGKYTETSGWANWETNFKKEIFRKLYKTETIKSLKLHQDAIKVAPELWLCGHFHGNVHAQTKMNKKWPIDVVTTGSVGTTMLWNGSTVPAPNFYNTRHASKIAKAVSGGHAFGQHIYGGKPFKGSKKNVEQRISASKDLSGLRVVQFSTTGQYRHKWFTLNEFEKVSTIDDTSMTGSKAPYSSSSPWRETLPESREVPEP